MLYTCKLYVTFHVSVYDIRMKRVTYCLERTSRVRYQVAGPLRAYMQELLTEAVHVLFRAYLSPHSRLTHESGRRWLEPFRSKALSRSGRGAARELRERLEHPPHTINRDLADFGLAVIDAV